MVAKEMYESSRRALHKGIVANLFLFVVKLISGLLGNSYALIADAIESLTDVISSFLVLLGLKYAYKPADKNHPYGHGKAEPLITFLVSGFLIFSAILIAIKSIDNIQNPDDPPKEFTLIVLVLILFIKESLFQFMKRKAARIKSTVLASDAWHHRADSITSLAALIGISLSIYAGEDYKSADDFAALFAGVVILFNAIKLCRPALAEIMDENQYDAIIAEIIKTSMTCSGVIEIEKCYVRKHGVFLFVDMHLIVDGDISVRSGHDISHHVKDKIKSNFPQVVDMMIHIEPN